MYTALLFGGTHMITEKAYAKINLSLDVTGKRPDGYHEVRMIMQTVEARMRRQLSAESTGFLNAD